MRKTNEIKQENPSIPGRIGGRLVASGRRDKPAFKPYIYRPDDKKREAEAAKKLDEIRAKVARSKPSGR